MVTSPLTFHGLGKFSPRLRVFRILQARARAQGTSGEDEFMAGKSSTSIVDANMGVLKERVEIVRMQEMSQRWRRESNGWHYKSQFVCSTKNNRSDQLFELLKFAEVVVGTFGLTILSCTLCLCLVSFLTHMSL